MHIVIYGAGSVGCYLGAVLQQEGLHITLLGRPRMAAEIREQGCIRITDYIGTDLAISNIRFEISEAVLSEADVVLVTLKCLAMEDASARLIHYCRPGTRVVLLQNGLGSDHALRNERHNLVVLKGITGFNVLHSGPGHFYRATEGTLHFEEDDALLPLKDAFEEQQISVRMERDFEAVAWGKLQLNLNNAINALADIPLKEELSLRGYRRILSAAMRELALVARHKCIHLAKLTALPPALLPALINSPDFLFHRFARTMLDIDPQARSSMWEDLHQGRQTEIHFLNGALVEEADKMGLKTPVNRALCRLIHEVETGQRLPGLSAEQLAAEIAR